jgi:hypothetical protein
MTRELTTEHSNLVNLSISRAWTMPEFKIKNFVGNAQITPYAKLKQYLTELSGRQSAVENMEYEHKKLELQIELEKEYAESAPSPAQRKLHELEVYKLTTMLTKSTFRLRDTYAERDLYIKVIEEFNNSPEARLADGRLLMDILDDPEMCERLEKEHWTMRLAKQTAMDMIAYGRAGVGNMEAVTMLEPEQQMDVMKIACEFFIRNENRTNALLNATNEAILSNRLQPSKLAAQLVFNGNQLTVSNQGE